MGHLSLTNGDAIVFPDRFSTRLLAGKPHGRKERTERGAVARDFFFTSFRVYSGIGKAVGCCCCYYYRTRPVRPTFPCSAGRLNDDDDDQFRDRIEMQRWRIQLYKDESNKRN